MNQRDYRRRAVLTRIHKALDALYLRQEVDWTYDIRKILDAILELAMKELEFGEGRAIDHALIIIQRRDGEPLEVGAGWNVDDEEKAFSRTIVEETLRTGFPVLCENARHDPRFENSKSIQKLEILSLLSVPIESDEGMLGALYIERRDSTHLFTKDDRGFLREFAGTIAPYVKTALIHQAHVLEIRALRERTAKTASLPDIIGSSPAIREATELARVAAGIERTVLITGESGCGKELIARAIHAQGLRADKPFVVVDCSALSESLLESELFGHVKGSFTGAVTDKAGAFEQADGGTLFLDEISDASKPMQQQLRRVLQEREIRRVGESEYRPVDVRVICATNRDLEVETEEGKFIHDLYHRILEFPIRVPALRERLEDLPALVNHFIGSAGARKNPPVRRIESEALAIIVSRQWRKNNVRELQNLVKLAIDLSAGDRVDVQAVHRALQLSGEEVPDTLEPAPLPVLDIPEGDTLGLDSDQVRILFDGTDENAEKEDRPYYRIQREFTGKLIIESLRYCGWKLRPAARLLGISPVKLRQDLRAWIEIALDGGGSGGSVGRELTDVAARLEMPEKTLRKKLADLGLEEATSSERESQP